ncbi:MAG: hypothetical protein OEW21_09520 [Betaproteobacteria bacterium]|nr:hypothetical protein [Betaproteobacteria bacterium]
MAIRDDVSFQRWRSRVSVLASVGVVLFACGFAARAADLNDEFRKYQKGEQESFKRFKDERDREFADFLRTQWEEFQSFRGVKRDPTPKPVVVPRPPPVVRPMPEEKAKPRKPPEPVVQLKPPPPPPPPPPAVPAVAAPKGKAATLAFYGQSVTIYYDPSVAARLEGKPSPESIANYWTALGSSEYEALMQRLRSLHTGLRLGDWPYADLVRAFSRQVHAGNENDERLLTWFLLVKSGYRARIAYDDVRIHLFITSDQQIYGAKFLKFQGTPYYAALARDRGANLGRVFTYDKEYPGQTRNLDLRIASLQFTKPAVRSRNLKFEYGGKRYAFSIPVDSRVVEFFGAYPQTDLRQYFSAATSEDTRAALAKEMRAIVAGMSEEEALNLMLRFVQTAFAYKTDEEQFGAEKYFFVEDMLFYPYSDCEDRSVLYAWLVREILGGDVVGLSYPGHVATAVLMHREKRGAATVDYNGKRYVVADPTYIGADLGMAMPQFARVRPEVIVTHP